MPGDLKDENNVFDTEIRSHDANRVIAIGLLTRRQFQTLPEACLDAQSMQAALFQPAS